jgi:hypothetical protein
MEVHSLNDRVELSRLNEAKRQNPCPALTQSRYGFNFSDQMQRQQLGKGGQ